MVPNSENVKTEYIHESKVIIRIAMMWKEYLNQPLKWEQLHTDEFMVHSGNSGYVTVSGKSVCCGNSLNA